jgi:cytochrome c peroxidase
MASLKTPPSPPAGDPEAIQRGAAQFNTLGCQTCHTPHSYTDAQLHDVGTGDPAKEKNSHGRGTSFDTPSLLGVWLTAPYFHDGTAKTLEEVFETGTAHNIRDKVTDEGLMTSLLI